MADMARFGPARRRRAACVAALLAALASAGARAADTPASTPAATAPTPSAVRTEPQAVPTAADPALEARMLAITAELRCLVCQNQTIADSHADLAADLRQEVRELIRHGKSDAEIRRYMTDRYGDFVLYKPPLKPTTLALWLGPGVLLAVAVAALALVIVRRSRLADDRFEPDPDWEDDAVDHPAAPASPPPGTPA